MYIFPFHSLFIYRDSLGWAVLLNFLVYITIPVVFQYTGILLAIGSFAVYMGIIIEAARREEYFWEQVRIAFFWLYLYFAL
jgi:hypothetical protein